MPGGKGAAKASLPLDNAGTPATTAGPVMADLGGPAPATSDSTIAASKYRRQSPKSVELKSSQVVQFPQRIVIDYESGDSPDPFASLIKMDKNARHGLGITRVPNAEALNLVGILRAEDGKTSALMEDLDGIGFILKPGDRVQNGYVADINGDAISFQINEYGWDRTVTKYMEKEE
jgi:hypothetical protein